MSMRLEKTDVLVVVIAAGWSVLLVVAGLGAIIASMRWPAFFWVGLGVGVAFLAAGQVVFLVGVADRTFREASKPIVAWLELLSCVILFTGLGLCVSGLLWPQLFA